MAELEIDREDVHDRKKLKKNAMKRKVQPYRKIDYKPILYIRCMMNLLWVCLIFILFSCFLLCVSNFYSSFYILVVSCYVCLMTVLKVFMVLSRNVL